MVNAASCDLPIEITLFALAESGPDSANGKGRRDVASSHKDHTHNCGTLSTRGKAVHLRGSPQRRGSSILMRHLELSGSNVASHGMDAESYPYQVA